MRNNELSAWTLLVASAVLGSVTMLSLSGCKPPAPTEVDVSTGEYVESNTTASDSNITTTTSQAVETPIPSDAAASDAVASDAVASDAAASDAAASDAAASENEADAAPSATAKEPIADNSSEVVSSGGDWPQWGGTRERNNTPGVKNLPLEWNIGKFDRRSGDWDNTKAKNIRWFSNLGSQTYGNPVIAEGQVYVGTNNGAGHLKRFPSKVDLGCLLAFDEKTGDFKWQHSSEKLITGRVHDWPLQGICCSPLVEGNRLWFVTSRGEVRCLDTEGFYDDEDDGPVKDEVVSLAAIMNAGPSAEAFELALAGLAEGKLTDAAKAALAASGAEVEGDVKIETVTEGKSWTATGKFNGVERELTIKQIGPRIKFFKKLGTSDKRDADVIWVYNMMGPDMGISQHNMCSCSVTSYGDLLFVNTGNGLDESHLNLPAPDAPSFICMNKNTGEVLWTDGAPAKNILHGQWSSPTVGTFDGVPQALFAGGDGILTASELTKEKTASQNYYGSSTATPRPANGSSEARVLATI